MNGKGVQKFMRDVPPGTILLIEADAAAVGYTLLTDKNDMHVYVSKGSGAGGETGGTDKTGGTWTQPDHSHAHSHTVNSHNHTLATTSATRRDLGAVIGEVTPSGNNLRVSDTSGTDDTALNYTDSKTPGTDQDSTGGATANTWRSPGRNFTRQQRN